jgi:hypothetical protein
MARTSYPIMETQKIHRIYTEDIRRKAVVRAISKRFASFTLQPTTGYYSGKAEKSIVLEIVDAADSEIRWLAAEIRKINQQSSVLVVTMTGRTKKITSNPG